MSFSHDIGLAAPSLQDARRGLPASPSLSEAVTTAIPELSRSHGEHEAGEFLTGEFRIVAVNTHVGATREGRGVVSLTCPKGKVQDSLVWPLKALRRRSVRWKLRN